MNKKEIIILAAIGAGVYILSQVKAMKTYIAPQYAKTATQKAAQKAEAQKKIRQEAAQKIAQRIAQKVAQKVAQKKVDISKMPVQQLRYLIAHAAAQKKTGKEVIALKAELARREAAWLAAQKVAPKRIGQPTTQAARIAALRKVAVRKAAAQKIGKIIGKKIAQKVAQKKVDISKIPVQQLRYSIAHAAAQKKTGKEVIALKAELARREAAWLVAHKVAQKVAQKKVASWKAPYRFPNKKFRVITPSDLLKNLATKDIAQKKALQQKKAQKKTPGTPSDRRKNRLEALYGSHWHDIWLKRQKR